MELIQIEIKSSLMQAFIENKNKAYQVRSSSIIKFIPSSLEDFNPDKDRVFGVVEDGQMVAGASCYYYDNKKVKIKNVWSDPLKRRKGYAAFLMGEIEKILIKENVICWTLTVVGAYKPAINLYKKLGFKPYRICAREPKTCCMISMIKYLPKKRNFLRHSFRRLCLIVSKIKYWLLFKKDCTPKLLYKILYKNK